MQTVKIKGSQGSWEAEVTYPDGRQEVLACVHEYFWKKGPSGACYDDPWTPELLKSNKFIKHVDLMRTKGRVIVTKDDVNKSKNRGAGFFARTGYVGVFDIDGLVVDDNGTRFNFTRRVANAA